MYYIQGFFHWLFHFKWPYETLTLHMKSGNKIVLDRIMDWSFKSNADGFTALNLKWHPSAKHTLLMSDHTLTQIEAITRSK